MCYRPLCAPPSPVRTWIFQVASGATRVALCSGSTGDDASTTDTRAAAAAVTCACHEIDSAMDHYATGYAVDDGESDAVGDGVYDAATDAVYDAVGDAVDDAVGDAVSDAVRDAVCDAVDSTVCDDYEDALKDCNTLELAAVLASQRAAAARCGRFGPGGGRRRGVGCPCTVAL